MAEDMHINPQRAKQLTENIASITSRINAARQGSKEVTPTHPSNPPKAQLLTRDIPGPPHRRLQTQTRKRYPRATQTILPFTTTPPNPLRRKLRPRTPREAQNPAPLHKMAHDRRIAIEQVQAAG